VARLCDLPAEWSLRILKMEGSGGICGCEAEAERGPDHLSKLSQAWQPELWKPANYGPLASSLREIFRSERLNFQPNSYESAALASRFERMRGGPGRVRTGSNRWVTGPLHAGVRPRAPPHTMGDRPLGRCRWPCPRRTAARSPSTGRSGHGQSTANGSGLMPSSITQHNSAGLEKLPLVGM
jgi:hypothetical protein